MNKNFSKSQDPSQAVVLIEKEKLKSAQAASATFQSSISESCPFSRDHKYKYKKHEKNKLTSKSNYFSRKPPPTTTIFKSSLLGALLKLKDYQSNYFAYEESTQEEEEEEEENKTTTVTTKTGGPCSITSSNSNYFKWKQIFSLDQKRSREQMKRKEELFFSCSKSNKYQKDKSLSTNNNNNTNYVLPVVVDVIKIDNMIGEIKMREDKKRRKNKLFSPTSYNKRRRKFPPHSFNCLNQFTTMMNFLFLMVVIFILLMNKREQQEFFSNSDTIPIGVECATASSDGANDQYSNHQGLASTSNPQEQKQISKVADQKFPSTVAQEGGSSTFLVNPSGRVADKQDQTRSKSASSNKKIVKLSLNSGVVGSRPDNSNSRMNSNSNAMRNSSKQRNQITTSSFSSSSSSSSASSGADEPPTNGNNYDNLSNLTQSISITPRVMQIRVPVHSNTILKCLISSSQSLTSKFNNKNKQFDIHWSRYMYDENVYEQIESLSSPTSSQTPQEFELAYETTTIESTPNINLTQLYNNNNSNNDDNSYIKTQQQNFSNANNANSNDHELSSFYATLSRPINRQQQFRDFLGRVRQETNLISDLLIEATLSISSVKASDNASYYCTATDGRSESQNKAKVDLIVLSKPIVHLEKVLPARDSKSALIYWLILSDGNTPIKKTILMVRNDSTINNNYNNNNNHHHHHIQQHYMNNNADDPLSSANSDEIGGSSKSSSSSSVVLDSDYNQWQRIEIPQDGEEAILSSFDASSSSFSNTANNYSNNEQDSVVKASLDVDVTSTSNNYQQQNNNDYSSRSRWLSLQGIGRANNILYNKRQRSFNLTSLLPGITYNFRLAALNDMGLSNWTYLTATMPNEIPAQINEVFLLSRKNDTLVIGWRRPAYDTSKTNRYEMQLFDLNRTLTLDANTNTSYGASTASLSTSTPSSNSNMQQQQQQKTNFMYVFFNLNPGTDYHFHVRACSKAGCSLYSSPKLLATTLDGESDEPMDVELSCQYDLNRLIVSWLPPINVRGQLINYSIQIDSYSRYKNSSNQWAIEEWRSTIETSDNHTLSLETSGSGFNINNNGGYNNVNHINFNLMPNTNYSVKVCANNRSKHCGRMSSTTSRSQCSIPPELPNEFPPGIQFKIKDINNSNNRQQQELQKIETPVLELPSFDRRNGSIDCIQIVLIRLPKTFNDEALSLNNFLPLEPSDIKLVQYPQTVQTTTSNNEASTSNNNNEVNANNKINNDNNEIAVAYLAEELSDAREQQSSHQNNNQEQGDSTNNNSVIEQITLGDGTQNICNNIFNNNNRKLIYETKSDNNNNNNVSQDKFRVFDGTLKAQTYYSGFIKLILIRPIQQNSTTTSINPQAASSRGNTFSSTNNNYETLTKYSNYFKPIKSGNSVIEVPLYSNDDLEISTTSNGPGGFNNANNNNFDNNNPFSLNAQMNLQEMASQLSSSLSLSVKKLYNQTSGYFSDKIRLERIGNYITQSSPLTQVFFVGMVFISIFLLFILFIWCLTIPASNRRKRKRKMKRQLEKHQEAILVNNNNQNYLASSNSNNNIQQAQLSIEQQQKQHHHHQQQQQPPDIQDQLQGALPNSNGGVSNGAGGGGFANLQQQSANNFPSTYNQHQQVSDGAPFQQAPANLPIQASSFQNQSNNNQAVIYNQHHQQLRNNLAAQANQAVASSRECPIHSSPRQQNSEQLPVSHVCPGQQVQQALYTGSTANGHRHHYGHHHYHHHNAMANKQMDFVNHELARQEQYDRNCRTMRRITANNSTSNMYTSAQSQLQNMIASNGADLYDINNKNSLTLGHNNVVLNLAKKFNKSIPLRLFGSVFERRLRHGWLAEEYEQLPRPSPIDLLGNSNNNSAEAAGGDGGGDQQQQQQQQQQHKKCWLKLRPQMVVSRDDTISALISGRDKIDASLIKPHTATVNNNSDLINNHKPEKRIICAKSPLDPDSVWDFWRLVYEQEVSTLVMLTQTEDLNTGECRCAQYWPTQDNEETTILSPCNEYVQKSTIPPAKFKIRQETFDNESREDDYKIRRLTLVVMATKPSENDEQQQQQTATNENENKNNNDHQAETSKRGESIEVEKKSLQSVESSGLNEDDMIIVERSVWHLQFYHWNTSTLANQMRLIKFIELANEKHISSLIQESPSQPAQLGPMLVHCYTGLGRSGLFTAMSYVIDELSLKLNYFEQQQKLLLSSKQHVALQQQQRVPKLNLFQIVSRLRLQRDMILSPYRFYELLYQLTTNCIPNQDFLSAAPAPPPPPPLLQEQALVQQHRHQQQQHHNHHHHHHEHQPAQQYQNSFMR